MSYCIREEWSLVKWDATGWWCCWKSKIGRPMRCCQMVREVICLLLWHFFFISVKVLYKSYFARYRCFDVALLVLVNVAENVPPIFLSWSLPEGKREREIRTIYKICFVIFEQPDVRMMMMMLLLLLLCCLLLLDLQYFLFFIVLRFMSSWWKSMLDGGGERVCLFEFCHWRLVQPLTEVCGGGFFRVVVGLRREPLHLKEPFSTREHV